MAQLFWRRESERLVSTPESDGVADVAQVKRTVRGRAHEVLRLAQVAEQAAQPGGDTRRVRRDPCTGARQPPSAPNPSGYRGGFDGD